MDLSSLINKNQCECLNESDDHTLKNVFQKGKSLYLESNCDEQVGKSMSFCAELIKMIKLMFLHT